MCVFNLCLIVALVLSWCPELDGQIVSGVVIDHGGTEPIPFVNIGVVGTNIGTVSDEVGVFEISLEGPQVEDVLRFSYIGYESVSITIGAIRNGMQLDTVIMTKKSMVLDEVVITATFGMPRSLGVPKKKCFPIPLFKKVSSNVPFPQEAYGHEIGTLFGNEETIQLDSIYFHFVDLQVDTIDFRLNVYQLEESGFMQLLSTPVYFSVHYLDVTDVIAVDISDQNINITGAFLVTIENYKQVKYDACRMLANFKKIGRQYPTYYRSSSQSDWRVLKKKSRDFGLSILAFVH